jgi:hypothetical protein
MSIRARADAGGNGDDEAGVDAVDKPAGDHAADAAGNAEDGR